jgi:hypothetical protein
MRTQLRSLLDSIRTKAYIKNMSIADTIRQAAKASGLSIYMIAKRSGLHVSMVQRHAAGGGLNCTTAEKIAAGLGYEIVLRPIKRKAAK